ncbi:MAG: hypothetical protein RL557_1012 [archaeon]
MMKQEGIIALKEKRLIMITVGVLLLLVFIFAAPVLEFLTLAPGNATHVTNTTLTFNLSIIESSLDEVTWHFNGTNYTLMNDSLVLLFNFDNESAYGENDTRVFDFSGNGNNGTSYSGVIVNASGKYGSGVTFNGSGGHINISDSNTLDLVGNFTITLWNRARSSSGNAVAFDKKTTAFAQASGYEFYHASSVGGIIDFIAGNETTVRASVAIEADSWHFYTVTGVTVNDTSSNITIYYDTVYKKSSFVNSIVAGTDILEIGVENPSERANGTLDELAFWNRTLTKGEINQLYQSRLKKYVEANGGVNDIYLQMINTSSFGNFTMNMRSDNMSYWNVLMNQSGFALGQSYNYNMSATDMANSINNTGLRTVFGNSLPEFISVGYVPNNSDGVDPSTVIALVVNVTDSDGNFDTAVLQWKNESQIWTNVTLVNTTAKGVYTIVNGSFTTPSYETNVTFRIFANDTQGDGNFSVNYTFNSSWDCSWMTHPDSLSGAGWDENKYIGNISINNTGDAAYANSNCSLDFRLSYTLSEGRVYFDTDYIKPSATYTLGAKTNRTISVNATFLSEITEEIANISISEFRGRSNMSGRNSSLTLVSNQAGPYLFQSISSSPSSVDLKNGNNFSLQGYIRNLMGASTANISNTAYNVTFNWSVPSDFTNLSGILNASFVNLTNNSLIYNNINLSFSSLSSMTAGVKTFYLYAQGYNLSGDLVKDALNATLLTKQVNITFLCYETSDGVCVSDCGSEQDPDCTSASSGASAGSGGGGAGTKQKEESSEAVFELLRGKNQEFTLTIDNKLTSFKKNLVISVSGLNSKYISVSPNHIDSIESGGSRQVHVRITAPDYFVSGKYILIFSISGDLVSEEGSTPFSERKQVTLYLVELTREEADEKMNDARALVAAMEAQGMVVEEVNDLLDELANSYDEVDFLSVKNTYEALQEIHDAAFESFDIITDLTNKIAQAEKRGITVSETKKLFYIAQAAYTRGDYLLAVKQLKEAQLSYALEVKGEFNLLYAIKNHPGISAFGLLAFLLVGVGSSFIVRMRVYKSKLRYLKEEEKLLLGLMKVVQVECFQNNKMSMDEYDTAMNHYESKLRETIEDRIRTETQLANLFKLGGRKKALVEERKRLVEMIKKAQSDYLKEGTLETRVYENMLKSYSSRLSDVEEQLATLDAYESLQEHSFFKRILWRFQS